MEDRRTRAEIADMLGVSVSTIRKYEREFADYLEATPGVKGAGVPNLYSQHDVRVFLTIAQLRDEGVSYDDMLAGELADALDSGTIEFEPERAQQRENDSQGAVIPVEQHALLVGKYQATQEELGRALATLDTVRQLLLDVERQAAERLDEVQRQLVDAERRAAAGEATKEERDRLLKRLEDVEAKLDAERERAQAGLLARLFGRR